MKVDVTKKYRTRSGYDVNYLTDTGHPKYPIVGFIGDGVGAASWTSEGQYNIHAESSDSDLIEVEPTAEEKWAALVYDIREWWADDFVNDIITILRKHGVIGS